MKFLRVLEGHEFTRLGGEAPIKTDVRIIAATNTDLEAAVKSGKVPQRPLSPYQPISDAGAPVKGTTRGYPDAGRRVHQGVQQRT